MESIEYIAQYLVNHWHDIGRRSTKDAAKKLIEDHFFGSYLSAEAGNNSSVRVITNFGQVVWPNHLKK